MSNELAVQAPMDLDEKAEYVQRMSSAWIIPKVYQKQPANLFVAVEMGEALGIHPLVAINEINVINGTPSPSASLMASLARQAGHKVRITGDAESATCTIIRSDDPDYEHTATWDVKKAKDAGLWGKGHWAKDSATMLKWRAISECVRFACSEVLGGLKYTPEEVAEFTSQEQQHRPSRRVPQGDRHGSGPHHQSSADVLAAAASDPEPEPQWDVDSLRALVAGTESLDDLQATWKEMTPQLDGNTAREFNRIVSDRKQQLQQPAPEPVADDPTIDGEFVDEAS